MLFFGIASYPFYYIIPILLFYYYYYFNLNNLDEDEAIKKKMRYIIKHFYEKSSELSNESYVAKAMLVASGRPEILKFKKQFDAQIDAIAQECNKKVFFSKFFIIRSLDKIIYTFARFCILYRLDLFSPLMQCVHLQVSNKME